jgi:hypothetical protein
VPYGTGRRLPPGAAQKPGGGYGDDFPQPPSELMDQQYQRQLQGAPGEIDSYLPVRNRVIMLNNCQYLYNLLHLICNIILY